MTTTDEHLTRVSANIADTILDFVATRSAFTGPELHAYVRARVPNVSPGSPDRVLRDLRLRGLIDYRVASRRESRYVVLRVVEQGMLF